MIELTEQILETLSPQDIIYAEIAVAGAMGNEGGIIIYVVKENQLIQYETGIFTNEEIYRLTVKYISINENQFFDYYYGGFGNSVFIKKGAELKIKEEYFEYIDHGKKYKIYSSVKGVFNRVVCTMNDGTSPLEVLG